MDQSTSASSQTSGTSVGEQGSGEQRLPLDSRQSTVDTRILFWDSVPTPVRTWVLGGLELRPANVARTYFLEGQLEGIGGGEESGREGRKGKRKKNEKRKRKKKIKTVNTNNLEPAADQQDRPADANMQGEREREREREREGNDENGARAPASTLTSTVRGVDAIAVQNRISPYPEESSLAKTEIVPAYPPMHRPTSSMERWGEMGGPQWTLPPYSSVQFCDRANCSVPTLKEED